MRECARNAFRPRTPESLCVRGWGVCDAKIAGDVQATRMLPIPPPETCGRALFMTRFNAANARKHPNGGKQGPRAKSVNEKSDGACEEMKDRTNSRE